MRRDPRLINLHDKPLYRRAPLARPHPAAFGFGTALLSCASIALVTSGFFWLYDAVAHQRTPFVPAVAQAARARTHVANLPPEVPAPNMNAPAVLFAAADVPPQPARQAAAPANVEQQPAKTAGAPPKKRKVRAVKRLSPDAAGAFARANPPPTLFGRF